MQKKISQKCFCFLDNCIWILCVKLSLLKREYLSSVGNVFTDSPKILHILRATFSNSISFAVIIDYNKGAVL